MTLEDLRAVFVGDELGHVTLPVTDVGEPFSALRNGVPLHLRIERRSLPFENIVKELLRRVCSINLLGCFQQVESELMTIGLKEIVAPTRQAIDHLRPAHFLWATPGVQITVPVKRDAMLLDAHVAHVHFSHELIDRHSAGALERIDNPEPLSAANFRD